ncbi:MAG TPA: Asp-tRNA(Asn)/Glu-tRNA(Gln) amidotransferase subunit GatC [Candidatus Acidoferrum sp.]|nr:Asp-tRNA(Asn)/Glu-tRNA(Gln) amidotransferase subunit GatC [Candidatus Acidoferrum sp.]
MKISREDVLRVAELAHLELAPAEIEIYRRQLDEILNYVGKLQEIDVARVEPMAQAIYAAAEGGDSADGTSAATLREDVLRDCHTAEEVLKTAPDAAGPFFRVPKVIEK